MKQRFVIEFRPSSGTLKFVRISTTSSVASAGERLQALGLESLCATG